MTPASLLPRLALLRRLDLLGLVLLALATFLPNVTTSLPARDSGVFLYVGQRILQGETPYLDVWDHKGPLIHFVNALGVWLHPGGEAGIWAIEVAAILTTGILLMKALLITYGRKPAVAATLLFFGGLTLILKPGNFTEEYALLCVATAMFLLARTSTGGPSKGAGPVLGRWEAIAIGGMIGAAMLLRPNLAGTPVVVAAVIATWSSIRGGVRLGIAFIGWVMLGAGVVLGGTLSYFWFRGGLAAAWDAYITYNLVYLQSGTASFSGTLWEGLVALAPAGLPLFAMAGWLLAFGGGLRRRSWRPSVLVGLIALPLELILVGLAGRGLTHYYIAWLPIFAWLSAAFFERFEEWNPDRRSGGLAVGALTAVGLLLPTLMVLRSARQVALEGPRNPSRWTIELAPYPEEILLMWGAEASYNYFSGRPSPTRFVYQYPLYTCGYATPEMVDSLAADIAADHPLIVDTSPTNRSVPPLDPQARTQIPELHEECALSPEMVTLMDAIWADYQEAGRLASTGWIVYQRRVPPSG